MIDNDTFVCGACRVGMMNFYITVASVSETLICAQTMRLPEVCIMISYGLTNISSAHTSVSTAASWERKSCVVPLKCCGTKVVVPFLFFSKNKKDPIGGCSTLLGDVPPYT